MTDPRNRLPDDVKPGSDLKAIHSEVAESMLDSLKTFVAEVGDAVNDPDTTQMLLFEWSSRDGNPGKCAMTMNGLKCGGDFLAAISTACLFFGKRSDMTELQVAEALVTFIRRKR